MPYFLTLLLALVYLWSPTSALQDDKPTAAELSMLNKYIVNLQQSIGLQSTAQKLAPLAHPRLLTPNGGSLQINIINTKLANDQQNASLYKLPVIVLGVRELPLPQQPSGGGFMEGTLREFTLEKKDPTGREPGTVQLFLPADTTRPVLLYEIGRL